MQPVDMIQTQTQLDALRLLPADGTDATSFKRMHSPAVKQLEDPLVVEALETLVGRGLVGGSRYGFRLTVAGRQARSVVDAAGTDSPLGNLTIQQAQTLVTNADIEDYHLQGMKASLIDDEYYPTEPGVEDAVLQGWTLMVQWTADVLGRIAA